MTFPAHAHTGTVRQVSRSIARRAVALSALESGLCKDRAAERAGVTRGQLNRWLRADWRPGA